MDSEKLAVTVAIAALATVVGLAAFYFLGIDKSIAKYQAAHPTS